VVEDDCTDVSDEHDLEGTRVNVQPLSWRTSARGASTEEIATVYGELVREQRVRRAKLAAAAAQPRAAAETNGRADTQTDTRDDEYATGGPSVAAAEPYSPENADAPEPAAPEQTPTPPRLGGLYGRVGFTGISACRPPTHAIGYRGNNADNGSWTSAAPCARLRCPIERADSWGLARRRRSYRGRSHGRRIGAELTEASCRTSRKMFLQADVSLPFYNIDGTYPAMFGFSFGVRP
jgi:hypothetical protein